MKKYVSLIVIVALLLVTAISAFAFDEAETQQMALELEEKGMLAGVGKNDDGSTNFALRKAMTRQEAMVMLVKLLGKFDEAVNGTYDNHFTDVDDWAKPFVGYAYANGYTAGVAPDRFGAHNEVTANQYLTFVLKAMGYDASTEFDWRTAWLFTDNLGITAGEYNEENNDDFLRGDAINVTYGILELNSLSEETEEEILAENPQVDETADPEDYEIPDGLASPILGMAVSVPDNPEEINYTGLDGITEIAKQYLGVPYVAAGKTPAGFDCSGFVIYVMKEYGFKFTAGSCQDLYELCNEVENSDRQVGDIVFFKGTYSTDRMSHVGIYIGNNQMIHASTSYHGCICIVDLSERYWVQHFDSYGRMPG